MRSSNFLPSLNQSTQQQQHNLITNANNALTSPHSHNKHGLDSNIKLENRVFYVEKATARLIHAFESIGSRLTKIESDQNNTNVNISALSKAINVTKDSNKEFISKQHMIAERLIADIHKISHKLSQQTSFINKEVSDIRDSMQILSGNLQKNFNEGIKAAMKQCNELNVQNSNNITSLRTITDHKVSHLQQLIVDSQKRAQTQNTSILDIINSNQKNQAEFQRSFKLFFEKFRDSMHQNLSALQESSQEQISYLDNVLRAEVKTRMKNTQSMNLEIDNKIFSVQEIITQNKRDILRSCEYITKDVESVKEQQNHQQNATLPLHNIITNLTKQFDDSSEQHLTDIKSIMKLNQDTSEKQFDQIKSLQIQIQEMWSKISNQQPIKEASFFNGGISSPKHSERNPYLLRPQSYKSDMSSTAAFDAIKQHLANMPAKPTEDVDDIDMIYKQHSEYIQDDNEVSDGLSVHNSPKQAAHSPLAEISVIDKDVDEYQDIETKLNNDEQCDENESKEEHMEVNHNINSNSDHEDIIDVEPVNEAADANVVEKDNEIESNMDVDEDIDNLLDVEPVNDARSENVVEKESGIESNADVDVDIDDLLDVESVADKEQESVIDNMKVNIEESNAEIDDEANNNKTDISDMEDIEDILGDDEDKLITPQSDNYSEEYSEENNDKISEQKEENQEVDKTEKEQTESNESDEVQEDNDKDQYSDF